MSPNHSHTMTGAIQAPVTIKQTLSVSLESAGTEHNWYADSSFLWGLPNEPHFIRPFSTLTLHTRWKDTTRKIDTVKELVRNVQDEE